MYRLRVVILVPMLCLAGAAAQERTSAQQSPPAPPAAPVAAQQASRPAQPPAPHSTAASVARSARAAAGFDQHVKPFVAEYCSSCHNEKRKKGGLNLEAYATGASVIQDADQWEEVVRKLRAGEMPPEEEPQPDKPTIATVTNWVEGEITRAETAAARDPGRVTTRRLNRTEYNNSIRDLLGVDLRPAEDFPHDDSGYGFDNIGDVLSLSPVLMERYVAAADRLVRTALYGVEPMKATLARINAGQRTVPSKKTVPDAYDATGLSLPNALHGAYQFPVEADYVFKVSLGGSRPSGSEPLPVTMWLDGKELETNTLDPEGGASFFTDRQDFSGKMLEFRARVAGGLHDLAFAVPRLYEGLPTRYNGPNPSKRPPPPPEIFKPRPNATPEQIAKQRAGFEARQKEVAPVSEPRVGFVEIAGPYDQAGGPTAESLEKIFTCAHPATASRPPAAAGSQAPSPRKRGEGWGEGLPRGAAKPHVHGPDCAKTIVGDFARRAFRRPLEPGALTRYLGLVDLAKQHGDPFEETIAVALQAVLVSPDFLFRIEEDRPIPAGQIAHRISQHELATRLSYFLWASLPDASLRRAADRGTLRQPQVLAAQVQRMLKDARAKTLAEEFGGQWLQFRALESVTRDGDKFPDFENYLRISMRRETELFFEHIVREDRSILDFLDGRYTFVNERLARHYGLPGITGPAFRKVDLAQTRRGGVLTQGSVLTVSSYATRTSPVLRGKWVLDNLLGTPPPDPPPDIPNLDESSLGTSVSMRQQLEAHRKNATCASCHKRMDPLGFGLENFDAIGAWRSEEGKFPIDATGTLPDGRSFDGPDELRTLLNSDREAFTRALTTKLLTYALGRGVERSDRHTVKAIAKSVAAQQYRFSSLVLEIVKSRPFQMRRAPNAPRALPPPTTSTASARADTTGTSGTSGVAVP